MEWSPWEASGHSTCNNLYCIGTKGSLSWHNSLPIDPILRQEETSPHPHTLFFIIYFNITFPSTHLSISGPPFRCSNWIFLCSLSFPIYTTYTAHCILLNFISLIFGEMYILWSNLLHNIPASCYFYSLRYLYSPQTMFQQRALMDFMWRNRRWEDRNKALRKENLTNTISNETPYWNAHNQLIIAYYFKIYFANSDLVSAIYTNFTSGIKTRLVKHTLLFPVFIKVYEIYIHNL